MSRLNLGMRQLSGLGYVLAGIVVVILGWIIWDSVGANQSAQAEWPLSKGALAPDFSLVLFDSGETITLSDLKGQPVILNFFASWCPSCRAEAPDLQRFWQAYADKDIRLLSIAVNDSADGLASFKRSLGLSYPMGLDEGGTIAASYQVSSIPTFVLIDRKGRVAKVILSMVTAESLAAEAEALLD